CARSLHYYGSSHYFDYW
nr:immunoglobulin heavy chain junction region [Mus musculus]